MKSSCGHMKILMDGNRNVNSKFYERFSQFAYWALAKSTRTSALRMGFSNICPPCRSYDTLWQLPDLLENFPTRCSKYMAGRQQYFRGCGRNCIQQNTFRTREIVTRLIKKDSFRLIRPNLFPNPMAEDASMAN